MKGKVLAIFKSRFFYPALLFLVFLVSLGYNLFWGVTHRSYVFYYPEDFTGEISGERRSIPVRHSKEENLSIFLEELILGPVSLHLGKLVPSEIDLSGLILEDQDIYIDFSKDFVFIENGFSLSYKEIMKLIEKNVRFNFRGIKKITITVDGQIPESGYFTL